MISICIPTYEQKGQGPMMLRALLESIQKQSIPVSGYEIIISDNSKDYSIKKVCGEFGHLPIKYIHNPICGAGENINNAIDNASFDKIKLMMQDDIFIHDDAINIFSEALDTEKWVISNSLHINGSGRQIGQRLTRYEHGNFESNTIGMPSVIAFRKCDLRFNVNLKTFCDVYFYYRLYELYGQPGVINNFTVAQRFHKASLSQNQIPSHEKDRNYLIRNGLIKGKAPKIIIAVVVYDRHENIDRWIKCWEQSNTNEAQLIFIWNTDENTEKNICYGDSFINNIKIIVRKNTGYDIGAFQDVCKNRLPGFPDYDYLLWCTDDTIPMSKDFISPFIDSFNSEVGLVCMQISEEYTRHVRTTGFCIKKNIAEKLRFPADPITTVQQCWLFEHRGGSGTLLKQITRLGLRIIQVAPLEQSPLYDMGFWYRNEEAKKVAHLYDRMKEHEQIFNHEL